MPEVKCISMRRENKRLTKIADDYRGRKENERAKKSTQTRFEKRILIHYALKSRSILAQRCSNKLFSAAV
jgi:hypothetical protein